MLVDILILLVGIVIGIVIGIFGARHLMKKELEKNPPINEKMIETLMAGMGRKPNQKQVKQLMRQMNNLK